MFERNRSDEFPIGTGQGKDKLNAANQMTNLELLREIDEIVEAPDAEHNLDVDKLAAYLAKLQERAPVEEEYVPGEVWNGIKETYPQLFEATADNQTTSRQKSEPHNRQSKRENKPLMFARVAGLFAAAMLALVVTANAFGFNPIQAFLSWADDIIQVYSNPSGIMELPAEDLSEYHSLEEALEANGIDSGHLPTWVPKDYTLRRVDVRATDGLTKGSALYGGERGDLLIRVTQSTNSLWSSTSEKEVDGDTYQHNGEEYYIVTNSSQGKAGWQIGDCSYVIDGQVTGQELKQMIDSIS